MIEYKKNDLIMFVDAVGHVAMATYIEPIDEKRMRIKNPLWVSMVPRQAEDGSVRISMETPAWAFRDLMADHNDDQFWDISIDKYNFYEGKSFSDILKLHYYNSYSRIENGVRERLDQNGNKVEPSPAPPATAAEPEKKPEQEEKVTPELKPQS